MKGLGAADARLQVGSDVRCMLALSSELLGYGLPVHRVEESVMRLARAFGRPCSVLGLPTTLTLSIHDADGSAMHMVRAEPGTAHLGRLDALHRLVGRVERAELDADGALAELHEIVAEPPAARWSREALRVALVAAGGAQLLRGDPADSLAAALVAAVATSFCLMLARRSTVSRVVPVLAASCVTLSSAALAHVGLSAHPLVVSLSALLVLMPGFMLTLSAVELATGHLVCGTARAVGAGLIFLQLGFGVLLGVRLGAVAALSPTPLATVPLWLEGVGAAALAAGFAGLLNTRRADLVPTACVTGLAWTLVRGLSSALGVELAVLIAACAVGLVSNALARRWDRPSSIFLVPGMFMLVPGSLGMLSISSALLHDPSRAFASAVHMVGLLMALSTGVVLATAVLPPRSGL